MRLQRRWMLSRLWLLWVLFVVPGCGGKKAEKPAEALKRGVAEMNAGELRKARQTFEQIPESDPSWAEAQLRLGDLALRTADRESAAEHYEAIPQDGSPLAIAAAFNLAALEKSQGRLNRAIGQLQRILEHAPEDIRARTDVGLLYAATGQRFEADGHYAFLMKHERIDFKQLVMLTDIERTDPEVGKLLWECERQAPDDPAVLLGLALIDLGDSRIESAFGRLERAVKADPNLGEAQGRLGELLLERDEERFRAWYLALPESVSDHPSIWIVRGLYAQRQSAHQVAARCFGEALKQLPASHRAMHLFGLAMNHVDEQAGRDINAAAQKLYRMRANLSKALNSRGGNQEAMKLVIKHLIDTGRHWEAWTWCQVEGGPSVEWIEPLLEKLGGRPRLETPRILPEYNLALKYDAEDYPEFESLTADWKPAPQSPKSTAAQVRFVDEAANRGVEFLYHQGRVEGLKGVRMFESTGGGVGVLDFDLDGRPDLFLTQGEDWQLNSNAPSPSDKYRDKLYQNLGDSFRDVTITSMMPEEGGFGQGVSAGDFNNDGFPDLYIANAGANQLLINNGDGTFTDHTLGSKLTGNAWTTSCLIVDIDGDSFPDLLDVNYVEGKEVFSVVCNEHNCSPQHYQPAQDQWHLSSGDGRVRFIDRGKSQIGGPGLGVVAFRLEDAESIGGENRSALFPSEGLSFFIANDQEPNFYWRNRSTPGQLDLEDVAFLAGLAVNHEGRKTACMGVASGDANGDGLLDLFVTNYKNEANNLYLQSPGGYFVDAIAGSGLMHHGIPYVGWGTQFLDADNDGDLDLAVSNGHVADFEEEGIEYLMPTQLFLNRGKGEFDLLPPELVGEFFAKKILGRSLATIDWNLDGRTDFALSSIGVPFALLTNHTENAGNFLSVRLTAVNTARDARGAFVTLKTSSRTMRKQLTAGDGYQVTNERLLSFGLSDDEEVQELQIEWPSGQRQEVKNIPANVTIDVTENLEHHTVWRDGIPAALGD